VGWWRFQRRFRVLPGVRLNLSKSSASVSLGVRGAHLTLGRRPRLTLGWPGSGISYTQPLGGHRSGCLPAGTCTTPLHERPCVLPACNPAAERVGRLLPFVLLVGALAAFIGVLAVHC
jgi:Protein of unknown function (DUF4236)